MSKTDFLHDDIGLVYIAEESTLSNTKSSIVDVYDKYGVFYVTFDTILHTFGDINRNNRCYLAENVWECILQEKIQELINTGRWFGEMDHPTNEYKDNQLSPERVQSIWMPNRSHKIKAPKIIGDTLQARIETASGTDAGVGFAKEIIQGMEPAFSCRAIAVLKTINGKPTVVIRRIITYDWVLYPSHKRATAISTPKAISKQFQTFTESVIEKGKRITKDIVVPLKDILESVCSHDVNTQMILESFDLPLESVQGFSNDRKNVIIKDNDNLIYAKISPETKHRVDDYLANF